MDSCRRGPRRKEAWSRSRLPPPPPRRNRIGQITVLATAVTAAAAAAAAVAAAAAEAVDDNMLGPVHVGFVCGVCVVGLG